MDSQIATEVSGAAPAAPVIPTLQELEARHIADVLATVGGNQRRAARALGITRWALARRVKKYGLRAALVATAIVTAIVVARPAGAARVAGGGSPRNDCYAELDVDGATVGGHVARCIDGDPACDADGIADGSCTFRVAVCLNQGDARPTCEPPSMLESVKTRGAAAVLDVPSLASSTCGAFVDVDVPVKVRHGGRVQRPGRRHLPLVARAAVAPRVDRDDVVLECDPAGSKPAVAASACPANPRGPDTLVMTVKSDGTDLDNGWTGTSQNLPIPGGTKLTMCLAGCTDGGDPRCDATVTTGAGTANGTTFGPPLPVFVAGVPSCIVNEYAAPVFTGAADLATGAIDGTIALRSHIYLTDATNVCPRCIAGRCNAGPRVGLGCTVDGTVFV
ncbi:MAG TPA: helix-turn-helix domain-containing protein, partial [Candidatus Binatia bacterium]|nr:helix-turn-helix domain-containing protein [Candidatus Binatia bacterium]